MAVTKTRKKMSARFFVKLSCVAGLFALLFFAVVLGAAWIRSKGGPSGISLDAGVKFNEKLSMFDRLFEEYRAGSATAAALSAPLAALEKNAVGAEGALSVLKRRRLLARADSSFAPAYLSYAAKAAARFPHSAALAAVAGSALIDYSGEGLSDSLVREKLSAYAAALAAAGPLVEKTAMPLSFSFYALSGALSDMPSASALPSSEALFLTASRVLEGRAGENAALNGALMKIVSGKIAEAPLYILPLSEKNLSGTRAKAFLANYAYDFGDLITAARLWTETGGEENLAKAAGAFYLAGRTENASQLWYIIASPPSSARSRLAARSLFNIARVSRDHRERIKALERLLEASAGDYSAEAARSGVLLYTRLSSFNRAAALLEEIAAKDGSPVFALELFRRKIPAVTIDKAAAEVWLLIDEYWNEPDIYRWAAWFLGFHRRFNDVEFLAATAARRGISGLWIERSRATAYIRAGQYNAALAAYEEPPPADGSPEDGERWAAEANKGLIYASRRDFRGALSCFEAAREALSLKSDEFALYKTARTQAALLELQKSRCLAVLGRREEAREALNAAAGLDGEDIRVRVALERMF